MLAQLQEKQICWFQFFAPYPASPQLLSVQQALAGCNEGLCPGKIHFQTAAGHVLSCWPNVKLKHDALKAAVTVTRGAWEVFKDLPSLCFDCQAQQKLGSFDHRQGLSTSWPKSGQRLALTCRCAGAIVNQNTSLTLLSTVTATLLGSDLTICTKWSDQPQTVSLWLSCSL